MARRILSSVISHRSAAIGALVLASAILVADKWPADARVSQMGGELAVADADLAELPVMYE